jgi:biotin operon repressor
MGCLCSPAVEPRMLVAYQARSTAELRVLTASVCAVVRLIVRRPPNPAEVNAMLPPTQQVSSSIPVLCLVSCQSARVHLEIARTWFTLQGVVVVDVECASSGTGAPDRVTESKLAMSREVVVLNTGGVISEPMRQVIRLAQRLGKTVRFYERARYATVPTPNDRAQPGRAAATQAYSATGGCVNLDRPFVVRRGAVLLFGPDETRAAFTLVSDQIWPGVDQVPEVWYAESVSDTVVEECTADIVTLRAVGQIIRWAVVMSGQVVERLLCALHVLGSVQTQEELSAVIGCRRESVTTAMRELKADGLVEKHDGRIRLTARGIVSALELFTLEGTSAAGDGTGDAPLLVAPQFGERSIPN